MRLYLDIDGVLLTKRGDLANGAEAFLRWAIANHEPVWLSTRTRDGTHRGALRAFHGLLDPALIEAVAPALWDTLKVEALKGDWRWLDDELLYTERNWLARNNALHRFVRINLKLAPDVLLSLRW